MRRRQLNATFALALVASLAGVCARAETVAEFYKGKSIRIMVGASAGGGYDLVARLVASRLGAHIPGNPGIVVENVPAAGGLVMANTLYNAQPRDGTALGLPTNAIPLEPRLKLLSRGGGAARFDITHFGWIGSAAKQPQVMFIWHAAPVTRAEELKTTKTLIGAIMGADSYILPHVMNAVMGARMQIIPGYQGLGDSLLAMERGEVQGHSAGLANITSAKPDWLRDGKLRILMQFGAERLPELPDVPTAVDMAESELDREMLRFYALKYEAAYSFIAPPGVPAERLAALRQGFNATMKDPAYVEAARRVALPLNPLDGDAVVRNIERIASAPEAVVRRLRDILDGIGKK